MNPSHCINTTLPAVWCLYGAEGAITLRLRRARRRDRNFPRFMRRSVGDLMLSDCGGLVLMATHSWFVWVTVTLKANSSSFSYLQRWLCVLHRWWRTARRRGGSAQTVVGTWTLAAFRYLFQDSVARDAYVERDGFEDRVEWRKQLDDSALLILGARELLLERSSQLVLSLKMLQAEQYGSMSPPQRVSD